MDSPEKNLGIKIFRSAEEQFAYLEAKEKKSMEAGKRTWWFKLSQKRWRVAWDGLTLPERAVMTDFWLYAGRKTDCWPSLRLMEKRLKTTRKTILRIVRALEKKGFVRTEKQISQRGRYNHYFLLK